MQEVAKLLPPARVLEYALQIHTTSMGVLPGMPALIAHRNVACCITAPATVLYVAYCS